MLLNKHNTTNVLRNTIHNVLRVCIRTFDRLAELVCHVADLLYGVRLIQVIFLYTARQKQQKQRM